MSAWFFNSLFTFFLPATYFLTVASITLLNYPGQDVGGYYALVGAVLSGMVLVLCFALIVRETVSTTTIFENSMWTRIIVTTLVLLMLGTAVLSMIVVAIIKNSGRESDVEVAFAYCVFSAFLSVGAVVLLIVALLTGSYGSTR